MPDENAYRHLLRNHLPGYIEKLAAENGNLADEILLSLVQTIQDQNRILVEILKRLED